MNDPVINIENRKITVSFGRKLDLSNYNNAEASIYLQGDVPEGASAEQIAEAANALFFPIKAVVFEQLGIPFDTTIDGRAMEVFEEQLGAVAVTARQEAQAVAEASNATFKVRGPATGAGSSKDLPTLARELVADPSKWFDNRKDKKNPAGPDFKRKGTGQGLWLTTKEGDRPDYWEGLEVPSPDAFPVKADA